MGLLVFTFSVGGWIVGWVVGVEIEINANSAPNWVGIGAGAELGKNEFEKNQNQDEEKVLQTDRKIQELQRNLQNSQSAAKRLNKELYQNRINHEKETKLIIKKFKEEIKT